jgi:hypothetical protein
MVGRIEKRCRQSIQATKKRDFVLVGSVKNEPINTRIHRNVDFVSSRNEKSKVERRWVGEILFCRSKKREYMHYKFLHLFAASFLLSLPPQVVEPVVVGG